MAFQCALGAFSFGARFALGRFADAMSEAIRRSLRLVLIAATLLAGAAEVDDLAQADAPDSLLVAEGVDRNDLRRVGLAWSLGLLRRRFG